MSYRLPHLKTLFNSKYIFIAIIFIVSIGVYLNTLSNDFVYDDSQQVLQNPWIKDVRNIPQIFLSDVWTFRGKGVSNYYRPLMHIIYMIDYYIFGLKPWGFHLTNIIFHSGVSILVFLIAFMLIDNFEIHNSKFKISFVAALLFATHPIHTEAVAWVAGIPELSFTFFYLLSFYFYIKADDVLERLSILSILFFFLATLCKETALTLPILLFVYDYSNRDSVHGSRFTIHGIFKRYLPYLIIAGIYFILRTYATGSFAPLKRHLELSNYEYFINIFPLFIQYLEKLIIPINLNAFYVLHPISFLLGLQGIGSLILTFGFAYLLYLSRRKNSLIFFSLLWIVIPLLPVLYIPALGDNTFTERYLYLPSVGFVILSSIVIVSIYRFRVLGKAIIPIVILILVIITSQYSIRTIERNYIWRDEITLWVDTIKKSPDGEVPYNNLGGAYYIKGLFDKAIEHYKVAIRLWPDYPKAHYNLGNAYYDKKLVDKAVEHYQTAIRLNADYFEAYYSLAFALHEKGWIDKAIEYYQTAIRLKPESSDAYNNLGNIYKKKGLINKAIEHYQIALRLNPDDPVFHYNLGNAYYSNGLISQTIEHYRIALKLKPNFSEAQYNLRKILENREVKEER